MYASAWGGDGGIRVYRFVPGDPPAAAKRGRIKGFSLASRRRLLDLLMAVPWADLATTDRHSAAAGCIFLTLTYPREYPGEWETWKRHLDAFRRALAHQKPNGFGAIWRMEYQHRGAPHFHILLSFDTPVSIQRLKSWALGAWARIVDSGDPLHLLHGADVRPVYATRGQEARLMHYLVKYLGKPDDGQDFGGRIWGGWYEIPQEVRIGVSFETRQAFTEFLRRVRRWGKISRYLRKVHGVTGLRIFCNGGSVLEQLSQGIEGARCFAC